MARTSGSSAAVWMNRSTEVAKLSYGWWRSMSPSRITSKMFRGAASRAGVAGMERRVPQLGNLERGEASAGRRCPAGRRPRRGRRAVSGRAGGSCCSLNSARSSCAQRRGHRGVHLDAHHLGEAPVPDLLLDQAEQVLRLVAVVDLEVGVPGDPEGVPARGSRRPGKSASRFAPITCSSGTNWFGVGSGTQRGRILGTFTRANRSSPSAPAEHHGEREAQVRDVGERMPRIDRERREDREDVGVEVRVEVRPVVRRRASPSSGCERDARARPSAGSTSCMQAAAVLPDQLADRAGDGAELGLGRHAVGGALHDAGRDLLLEAGDPHLEELVEVAAEDRRGT